MSPVPGPRQQKVKKRLNWQTHLTNQNAIKMTLEWFQLL